MRSDGFTLIEVVIALAVVALALLALVRTAGLGAEALAHQRETTFAGLVAANVLAETRIRERFPGAGRREGRATMAAREYRWELVVQSTEEPSIRRLDVHVYLADAPDSAPITTMTGFAGQR